MKTTMRFHFETADQLTQFISAQVVEAWDVVAKTATVLIETAEQADEANFNAEMALSGEVTHV